METPAPTPSVKPALAIETEDRIKHFSAEARAAYRQFQTAGDPTGIDPVIFAILADFVPEGPIALTAELAGNTRLIDDLGFDSLAITELVFFTEDLFGITIANEEIIRVRTLDDLRGFIRRKIAARAPG